MQKLKNTYLSYLSVFQWQGHLRIMFVTINASKSNPIYFLNVNRDYELDDCSTDTT